MMKVLIVEDESFIRKGLINTIDWLSLGCTIVGDASDGVEGLETIQLLNPDLVITDIKMPRMDGIKMLEEAQKTCSFHSIIVSSYSDFEYAKKAISLKVYEYLLKPIDDDELAELVKKIQAQRDQERIYGIVAKKAKLGAEADLSDLDIYIFPGSTVNHYVKETLKRIRTAYTRKLSIDEIAKELGVSNSFLSRKFREATSQSFLEVLNKFRVSKAIEALREGCYRIYEVSDLVGFGEYKYFCNTFKKHTGMAPREFMKTNCLVVKKREQD